MITTNSPLNSKRGRAHPLGYGYVGTFDSTNPKKSNDKSYYKQPEYETCFQKGETLATQKIYKKIDNKRSSISNHSRHSNETITDCVRIQTNISLHNYVETITKQLHEMKYNHKSDRIHLIAYSRNVCKLIECVEILKRKINGLHQLTELTEILVINEYIPLQKGLKTVGTETETTQIEIYLSFYDIFNHNHIGYQKPITLVDAFEIKEIFHSKIGDLQKEIEELKEKVHLMRMLNVDLSESSETSSAQNSSESSEFESECEEWDAEKVVTFIVNINKEKYTKYYENLLKAFEAEGIDGTCLKYLAKTDLLRLGVSQFKDRNVIFNQIQKTFKCSQ